MRCSLTHAKQKGRVPSPHAHFGCPFSQGMGSTTAWLLETLAPQGQHSWQKEKLNKSQLLCLLNSTMGEEGDTSAPEVLQRRLGNIPFPPEIPCSCNHTAQPCHTLAAQHSPAEPFCRCCFLPHAAHSSGTQVLVWLGMRKVCPTELGCKQELRLTAAVSQLSGFAPVVCQILSIHGKMMKNI